MLSLTSGLSLLHLIVVEAVIVVALEILHLGSSEHAVFDSLLFLEALRREL